ncbi:MAG: DNA-protecting protein DprA [Bacteroidetes bacterium]|nr:DNA-protecting protein DprA [Bacteroidota bacterium]
MNITSLIALQRFRGIGYKRVLKVAHEVPSDFNGFKEYVGFKFSRDEAETRHAWDQALQIIEQCENLRIRPVAVTDQTSYPKRLYSMDSKKPNPPVLYVKGSIDALHFDSLVISIIGTRHPTENGIRVAYDFGRFAAHNHIPVVSGLAYGCDANGHIGCLEHGGIAVAVMAHGLDMVYPPEHLSLADQIVEQNGCLVSEYPPGVPITRWSFVDRDRLQSGLSDSVIVIQTGKKGGTHHTAKFAKNQGRRIFCVQPTIDESRHPAVAGTYDIIQYQDAKWISMPEQLFSMIGNQTEYGNQTDSRQEQLQLGF